MKILIVSTVSGTINTFLIPHIKWLIEKGNEVSVASNYAEDIDDRISELGCTIYSVPFQRNPLKIENYQALKSIKQIVLNGKYEMVHVHTPVASLLTRFACRKIKGVTMVYTSHGFHFFNGAPMKNWIIYCTLERLAARWTDVLITMNDEDFDYGQKLTLRSNIPCFKVHGVGVDLNKFSPISREEKLALRSEYQYNPNDFIVIYVAELSYRKQQDLLIKSISRLQKNINQIKLLLVGDGELLETYKKMAANFKLDNQVEFLGYRKDIDKLLAMSDIAVSTSRQEGLPVNIMEAMATGLPIVVTNCRGNRDLITNNYNGIVVGVNDEKACANAIEKVYRSNKTRTIFSKNNINSIQTYKINNILSEMEEIYSNIFAEKTKLLGKKLKA
ncbi:glycosyl transferase [Heyndrickxia shackletonii]|uniref:Glycosyl transferase n=1 Tax=Heyndrickxia shackletonii TaxID=157838 RepID=A0A0Q3WY65_9BACI|nr:glycosyltransferase family 4 protein [Heyndrickxia shackletonii]KQL54039.1 glycosyl transferase [Heyndrickxia shackletonii]NEZ02194.1 glycosyltransferase family 4 protein [Heyndrickxia shackletonii]